jgi:hypothetical protein
MPFDSHERARFLADRAMVEGVSAEEQRWLGDHLAACEECSQYAEVSRRTLRALDSFAFQPDAAAALRVRQAVESRVDGMAWTGGGAWFPIPAALALTIAGSALAWQAAAWLAGRWNWPAGTWQTGFAVFWLLPSVVLDGLLLFRGQWMSDDSAGPAGPGEII